MSRTWAIVRREFLAFARSKAYVIGTLFGPLMIGVFFVLPIYFLSGGAERTIAIVDASGLGIGEHVSAALFADPGVGGTARSRTLYTTQVIDLSVPASVRGLALTGPGSVLGSLKQSVETKTIDGYLWLPNGLLDGAKAQYEGNNATNFGEMSEIRAAVQRAVQRTRLQVAGIDADAVSEAFEQVGFEAKKAGDDARGSTGPLVVLGQLMGFVIYFLVIIYGYAVARSIQEEKKDRIVEILLSSIRPENLMAGKVLGIAAAGILQVTVWAVVAGIALTLGRGFLQQFEGLGFELPQVPLWIGLVFLFYFAGGFFLYASMYAAVGAASTSDQEVQQMQFPLILPLMMGFFMAFAVLNDPDGPTSVTGSLIPFTSPVVMPIRATMVNVPGLELAASILFLTFSCVAFLWIGSRVYRVSILATGKRPTPRQLWSWMLRG